VTAIWNAAATAGSKKDKHLPTFWALWQFQERLSAGVAFRQQFWRISVSLERLSEAKTGAPDRCNARTKPGDRISGFWATPDEARRRRSHEKGRSAGRRGLETRTGGRTRLFFLVIARGRARRSP
jgi:hypothetical protein